MTEVPAAVYTVLRKLENGEYLHVASRDNREEVLQLVVDLNTHWPAEYIVRDAQGRDINITE
jgi:hypothetical protein